MRNMGDFKSNCIGKVTDIEFPGIDPVTPVKATTAVTQTLTCYIRDVTTALTVIWKDNHGEEITSGQGGYTIDQGSVDSGTEFQKSTLEIHPATLSNLGATQATFKCAAKSREYSDSAVSEDVDIAVRFHTGGKFLKIYLIHVATA